MKIDLDKKIKQNFLYLFVYYIYFVSISTIINFVQEMFPCTNMIQKSHLYCTVNKYTIKKNYKKYTSVIFMSQNCIVYKILRKNIKYTLVRI